MLVNIILVIIALIGFGILVFYLGCAYKQYNAIGNSGEVINLFPKEDIYLENAYEDAEFAMSSDDKNTSERWAATQRGSVRIACGVYFTSDGYKQYKEDVLKMELP